MELTIESELNRSNLGFIDTARIEHISTFNCFEIGNDELFCDDERSGRFTLVDPTLTDWPTNELRDPGTGLFIQASFFNHSCLGSNIRKIECREILKMSIWLLSEWANENLSTLKLEIGPL